MIAKTVAVGGGLRNKFRQVSDDLLSILNQIFENSSLLERAGCFFYLYFRPFADKKCFYKRGMCPKEQSRI